jgi:hypothetical protein
MLRIASHYPTGNRIKSYGHQRNTSFKLSSYLHPRLERLPQLSKVRKITPIRLFSLWQIPPSLTVASIPGLRFFPQFLREEDQNQIQKNAFALHNSIHEAIVSSAKPRVSQKHNLQSVERYLNISLLDIDARELDAQHFAQYGEGGHELNYFIGNKNIPSFIKGSLIAPLENLEEIQKLMKEAELQWNFTFNIYAPSKEQPNFLPGFGWHTDADFNGMITVILTLLSEAEFQMKRASETEPAYKGLLTPGSLLMLSKEARWEWQHRVIPKAFPASFSDKSIGRMSLVLGCQPHKGLDQAIL